MAAAKNKRTKPASPSNAMSLPQAIARARALMQEQAWAKADALARKLFAAAPNNSDVLQICATLAEKGGHLQSAHDLLARATQVQPAAIALHLQMARVLHRLGRYKHAIASLEKALALQPDNADAHLHMGNVLASLGQTALAEHHYRQTLAADPGSAAAHGNLARALLPQGRAAEAVAHAQKAIALEPDNPSGYMRLAAALDRLGQMDGALAAHQKAIALAPDDPSLRLALAQSLAGYGEMERAREAYRDVIARYPDQPNAYTLLAGVSKFKADDPELKKLSGFAGQPNISAQERSAVHFALGKTMEGLGDTDAAFDHFVQGNRLVAERAHYSPVEAERFFAELKKAFSPEIVAQLGTGGEPDATPIFVLGMPRSGTSLVEQILASHPKVSGAGELALMSGLARQACVMRDTDMLSRAVPELEPHERGELGARYIAQLRPYAPDAPYIVDKMPANFLYIGLIHLILPNAKIIHCRRDARDNCLSIFKTSFTEGALAWSYDMKHLGAYYRLYDDLMAHWQRVLPHKIFTVQYEQMVAEQEAGSRALLTHCGLDWDDKVLQFHKTARPVHTASIAQVRQPIYKSSVGAADRYGDRLAPLWQALGPELAGRA